MKKKFVIEKAVKNNIKNEDGFPNEFGGDSVVEGVAADIRKQDIDAEMDFSCLAEGIIVPADFEKTGINLNELIVGSTGSGKSFSNAYSRLLHTKKSSVVVTLTKKEIKEKFSEMFENRDYEVIDLDFAHPENSRQGFDPLCFIRSDDDVLKVARPLARSAGDNPDPYWLECATSMIAAEIGYIKYQAEMYKTKKYTFADVIKFHRSLEIDYRSQLTKTNFDDEFAKMEKHFPGNQASQMWRTVKNLSSKTFSCIYSQANSAFDKVFSDQVIEMIKKPECVSFRNLGKKKTALFITTSPSNRNLTSYVNYMYSIMFDELFEGAMESENGCLEVPVHIICDDFACGCPIDRFEDYISVFRAAGISVSLLLQSETQLAAMYGSYAATTIINNCDTYIFLGGMDIQTCKNIAARSSKTLEEVLKLPMEQVLVFRRGCEPIQARRYQTLKDPLYQELAVRSREGL